MTGSPRWRDVTGGPLHGRERGDRIEGDIPSCERILEKKENQSESCPAKENDCEQPVCERFLTATFDPEFHSNGGVDDGADDDDRGAGVAEDGDHSANED